MVLFTQHWKKLTFSYPKACPEPSPLVIFLFYGFLHLSSFYNSVPSTNVEAFAQVGTAFVNFILSPNRLLLCEIQGHIWLCVS